MYDQETLDVVVVATPNAFHEQTVVAALERGYDVLCEKPLAHDLASAERIAAAAAAADGFCMVNFHNRLSTGLTAFHEHRRDGRFGEITHVQANLVRFRGIPGNGSWFTDHELAGGGAVIDIGVHAIDFALSLVDFPVIDAVFAVTRSRFGARQNDTLQGDQTTDPGAVAFGIEDSATAIIRCADGQTISLEVAWAANQQNLNQFVIRGTNAGARLELGGDELTLIEPDEDETNTPLEATVSGEPLAHTGWSGCDKRFLDGVSRGEQPDLNTLDEALTVQRVVDAIYRSAETGQRVAIAGSP